MKKPKKIVLLNLFLLLVIFIAFYFALMTKKIEEKTLTLANAQIKTTTEVPENDFNIWLIFTKVSNRSSLKIKFGNLLYNLLNTSTVPLKFHVIVDEKSKSIANSQLSEVVYKLNKSLVYTLYNIQECAAKITDIVDVMTPYFSSKPGTYYSDPLFYISVGLYRIAPVSQKRAVLLDCDLYFKKDVYLLFHEFKRFKPSALFGLAPELTPVYRHILHMYKLKHKTTFGEFYHKDPIWPKEVHPHGFQGYNSGVVLVNLDKQRKSKEFSRIMSKESVQNMTAKYNFRGHLGDQDFYTLLGYEYPDLIETLHCGFNRQLCTWWKHHGYNDIFNNYFKCDHPVVVLHGNCNTKIPKD